MTGQWVRCHKTRSWPAVTGDDGRWAEIYVGGHEFHDGTSLLSVSVDANSVNLTADEARKVAINLTEAADLLDEITLAAARS